VERYKIKVVFIKITIKTMNETKLIRGTDGYWRFPDTTADLRWVDKAIDINEILATTATPFIGLMKSNPKLAETILDRKIAFLEKNEAVESLRTKK